MPERVTEIIGVCENNSTFSSKALSRMRSYENVDSETLGSELSSFQGLSLSNRTTFLPDLARWYAASIPLS